MSPGSLVLADDRQQLGAGGASMVINRGTDHGVGAGQRLTIFRRVVRQGGAPIVTIGSATVYSVRTDTAEDRIDGSTDAVYVGDLVALHR